MIILLARDTDTESKPYWALQGGNTPEIVMGLVSYLRISIRKFQSSDEATRYEGMKMLSNWKQKLEVIAREAYPEKKWDVKPVNLFLIPDDAVKLRIFRNFDMQETAIYWLEGDNPVQYKEAEKIEISKISQFI